jgi:uncharacterized membrane protein YedE/YeeE
MLPVALLLALPVGLALLVGQFVPALSAHAVYAALLVDRWPWWLGGLAIGSVVLAFLWFDNKMLGVSTGCAEVCQLHARPELRGSWRLRFLAGIVLGGFVAGRLAGAPMTLAVGRLDALVPASWPLLLAGGLLVGYGARLAGGCTSGHSIVGVAQGARSSLVATAAFLVAGFVATQILYGVLS